MKKKVEYYVACCKCSHSIRYLVEGESYCYENVEYPRISPDFFLSPVYLYHNDNCDMEILDLNLPNYKPTVVYGYCNSCRDYRPICRALPIMDVRKNFNKIVKEYRKSTRFLYPHIFTVWGWVYLGDMLKQYANILLSSRADLNVNYDHCVECGSRDVNLTVMQPTICPQCGGDMLPLVVESDIVEEKIVKGVNKYF